MFRQRLRTEDSLEMFPIDFLNLRRVVGVGVTERYGFGVNCD